MAPVTLLTKPLVPASRVLQRACKGSSKPHAVKARKVWSRLATMARCQDVLLRRNDLWIVGLVALATWKSYFRKKCSGMSGVESCVVHFADGWPSRAEIRVGALKHRFVSWPTSWL